MRPDSILYGFWRPSWWEEDDDLEPFRERGGNIARMERAALPEPMRASEASRSDGSDSSKAPAAAIVNAAKPLAELASPAAVGR